jgi:hypothetical protein
MHRTVESWQTLRFVVCRRAELEAAAGELAGHPFDATLVMAIDDQTPGVDYCNMTDMNSNNLPKQRIVYPTIILVAARHFFDDRDDMSNQSRIQNQVRHIIQRGHRLLGGVSVRSGGAHQCCNA